MIVASFSAFILLFVAVGVLSTLKNRHTSADYLLAGHSVKPWLAALSAVATNNSGYMFVGMIGYTYSVGLASIWLMIGMISGDFLASTFIHKRLRVATEKEKVLSFAGVLSRWHGTNYRILRIVGGVITVAFLGTYAAAQLNAGSKALHVLFDWDYSVGAIIGAVMVLLYCFAGGIRASIWTDAAQSFVMIVAMGLLFFFAVSEIGGMYAFSTALDNVSPTYTKLFPSNLPLGGVTGPLLFLLGWVFAGFAVVGQPHIMVRFMAMDTPKNLNRVRLYYYSWFTAFYTLTICAGLAARLLLPEADNFDAELALPALAQQLLPEILVGLILAGLFAATMSTADSQILSCSAAITRDFTRAKKVSYVMTKLATVFVVIVALSIALSGSKSVFSLVLIAWAALASAFAPLLTIYALGGKPSEKLALTMMFSGLVTMLIWRYVGLGDIIYEVAPGILAGLLPYVVVRLIHNRGFLMGIFKKF
ncbi:MAG: sodium/proline symporter [Bacteriovoracales bacterium]|nr:sodium/proline symporter [Bacteriovoracales bacterium]